jgi:hypothetical protein
MSHKKDNDRLRTERQLDKLRWETAKELGLEDERPRLCGLSSRVKRKETCWSTGMNRECRDIMYR